MLAEFERVEPQILTEFQSTLKHANDLTVNADSSLTRLSGEMSDITVSLQKSLASAGQNVDDLSQTLDVTAKTSSVKVDTLLASLNSTAVSLNASVDSLRKLADNPQIHDNLIATTRSVALTAKTFADLTGDLRRVTGNAETQAQLRDTVANIDAAAQKADSLLASLGGKSSVYGVDAGATPESERTGSRESARARHGARNESRQCKGQAGRDGGAPGGPLRADQWPGQESRIAAGAREPTRAAAPRLREHRLAALERRPRPAERRQSVPLAEGKDERLRRRQRPRRDTDVERRGTHVGRRQQRESRRRHPVLAPRRHGNGEAGKLGDRHSAVRSAPRDARRVRQPLIAAPFLQIFAGERDTLQRDRRAVIGLQTQF